jgi:hypothetical protein
MGSKFIPNGHLAFESMVRAFATTIAKRREAYAVSEIDCAWLTQQVKEFAHAQAQASGPGTGTASTRAMRAEVRVRLEEVVRRIANQIRANPLIRADYKVSLGIKERPKKLGKRTVPFAPPYLHYQGAPAKAGPNSGYHQLCFAEGFSFINKSKPNGAVRVELFVDLVAQGDPIPQFPGQYLGGRPWYLRSYTSSPIRVKHPVPPVPMQVVYWARWADARGNVGPFSQTCVARVEGWSTAHDVNKLLGPMPEVKVLEQDPKYITTITQLRQIDQVTVRQQQLLPGAGEAADAAETPARKQLPPMTDAA